MIIHRTPKFVMRRHPSITWTTNKRRHFTFDDGPGSMTMKFGKLLHDHHEQATFFIVGERFDQVVLDELIQQGHEIGWHSQTHCSFLKLTDDEILDELNRKKRVEDRIAQSITTFRFPYGYFKKRMLPLVEKSGMTSMMWSYKCDDYIPRAVDHMLKSYQKIKENDIILLHDVSDNEKNTYESLKIYLEENP